MDYIKEIDNRLDSLSGEYRKYEIFKDWITCSSIAIANQVRFDTKREELYMALVKKHGSDVIHAFCDMFGCLAMALEEEMEDVLGKLYMSGGLGNDRTGQFFTPFHVSVLTAEAAMMNTDFSNGKEVILNEPCSGGGAMIIATAYALKKRGINYQKILRVTANDLDWNSVYMTYLQLSLLGIKAKVTQGDTLSGEKVTPDRVLFTPAYYMI